jgi:hypothetical protein
MACLLSVSTHKLQPVDAGFMGPFKNYYALETE